MIIKHWTDPIKKRVENYPSLEDQLDMLWHCMHNEPEKRLEPFYSTILEIKTKFPKSKEI